MKRLFSILLLLTFFGSYFAQQPQTGYDPPGNIVQYEYDANLYEYNSDLAETSLSYDDLFAEADVEAEVAGIRYDYSRGRQNSNGSYYNSDGLYFSVAQRSTIRFLYTADDLLDLYNTYNQVYYQEFPHGYIFSVPDSKIIYILQL